MPQKQDNEKNDEKRYKDNKLKAEVLGGSFQSQGALMEK